MLAEGMIKSRVPIFGSVVRRLWGLFECDGEIDLSTRESNAGIGETGLTWCVFKFVVIGRWGLRR